jgi:hypothetical protein
MTALTRGLIERHLSLGGHALAMSATLGELEFQLYCKRCGAWERPQYRRQSFEDVAVELIFDNVRAIYAHPHNFGNGHAPIPALPVHCSLLQRHGSPPQHPVGRRQQKYYVRYAMTMLR